MIGDQQIDGRDAQDWLAGGIPSGPYVQSHRGNVKVITNPSHPIPPSVLQGVSSSVGIRWEVIDTGLLPRCI